MNVFDFSTYDYEVVMHILSSRRRYYYIRRVRKGVTDPTCEVVLCRSSLWKILTASWDAEDEYNTRQNKANYVFYPSDKIKDPYVLMVWKNPSTPQDILRAESPSSKEVIFSTRDEV
jgi:hypothetical protein